MKLKIESYVRKTFGIGLRQSKVPTVKINFNNPEDNLLDFLASSNIKYLEVINSVKTSQVMLEILLEEISLEELKELSSFGCDPSNIIIFLNSKSCTEEMLEKLWTF